MKTIVQPLIYLLLAVVVLQSCTERHPARILIFTRTAGYHHASIAAGVQAILKMAAENHFLADTTADSGWIREDTLKHYSAVVFLNTTGDLLNKSQKADFQRFIEAGGGYAGVHAAADAEYDWEWYGRLVGAYFNGHPEQQEAVVQVKDSVNDATRQLPGNWKRMDEWYNFKNIQKDLHILLTVDESSYKGGTNGAFHPVAWYHPFNGGRAWYTALGHTDASYADPLYLKHLLGGIQYAIGDKTPDYSKVTSLRVPDASR